MNYRGNSGEDDLVEEYIQSIIHNQIALDPTQLFAAHISRLKWIANEDALTNNSNNKKTEGVIYSGPDVSVDESDGPAVNAVSTDIDRDESNALWAKIFIPLGTVALLGAIWFFLHRHYRGKQRTGIKRTVTEDSDDTVDEKDIETGSVATGLTPDLESKNSSDSEDVDEGQSCTKAMAEAIGFYGGTLSTRSVSALESGPINVDSIERSAAGLPPRPIHTTKRMISKQLKRKRRKKKGKKKQVLSLTRVDSRKNIVEMPMISESESECDSDHNSGDEEYCDDGSSYDASNGCLTPVSRNSNGSRSSSPQKSPRREIDLTETVNRFEFLMDAPDFLQDRFPDSSTADDEKWAPPSASLGLQPRSSFEIEDDSKPHLAEASTLAKPPQLPVGDERLPALEIEEPAAELSTSFAEEEGNVMERMLPLPWLMKPNKNKRFV